MSNPTRTGMAYYFPPPAYDSVVDITTGPVTFYALQTDRNPRLNGSSFRCNNDALPPYTLFDDNVMSDVHPTASEMDLETSRESAYSPKIKYVIMVCFVSLAIIVVVLFLVFIRLRML